MKTRRDFLAQFIAAGGMATAPLPAAVARILEDSASRDHFKSLTEAQAAFLSKLADIIIPTTDTPSASDARVVKFIDGMLADWYADDERREYLQGLALCMSEAGPEPSLAYLTKLDAAAFDAAQPDGAPKPFYRTTKKLVLVGYFTSTVGMQQNLHTHGPIGQSSFAPSGPPGNDIRY